MRHFQDYKKHFKNSLLAVFFFSFLALIILPINTELFAQSAQELQNKIAEKDSDINRLEAEIAAYQAELGSIGKQKSSLASSIKELDLTRKKLVADISITERKIERTSFTIGSLSTDIGNKEQSIKNNRESIKLDLRKTNELETQSILELILAEEDMTLVWNDLDNIITLRNRLRDQIDFLQKVKVGLEDTRTDTLEAKAELDRLRSELNDHKKIVDQNTKEKNSLLTKTKNSEVAYQRLLKENLAKKEAFEKELREYESRLQFILDPSLLPNAGVLSWPLDKIFVTQMFGKTADSKRLYASGSHSGVDFRAAVGTPVRAMADGVVKGTGDTDLTCPKASLGKYVFVEYNNGLSSAFGHLSLIKLTQGETVKRGDIVGYSGNTGHSTGPHLHVSLYVSSAVKMTSRPSVACGGKSYTMPVAPVNAYLDPMYYLPPYRI